MHFRKMIGYIRIWLLFQRYNIKNILHQVKQCLWLFIIVCIIMSSEVWVPYIIGIISGNGWWYGIASACWLFWLGPGTPFFPLCIVITLGIRKLVFRWLPCIAELLLLLMILDTVFTFLIFRGWQFI